MGVPSDLVQAPYWLGSQDRVGSRPATVQDTSGEEVAVVGVAPRIVQSEMLRLARQSVAAIDAIEDGAWFRIFTKAAESVSERVGRGEYDPQLQAYSRMTGVPFRRAVRGVAALAGQLAQIEAILAAQSPDGTAAAYRSGDVGQAWRWLPAGRTAMVRVPSNFPTIGIEWLQVLAMRRPVLVNTSDADPLLASIFVAALYANGLPNGAVSVAHGDSEVFQKGADQVIWPGEHPPPNIEPMRLKMYHFGRSKAAVFTEPNEDELDVIVRLAFQGSGRLCTNVSAVLTAVGPERVGLDLARRFAQHPVLALSNPQADIPCFVDRGAAAAIVSLIDSEIAAGARDLTAEVGAGPLSIELAGDLYLRPTVLLVAPDSRLTRLELPFPFITVAAAEDMAHACRESLIVSAVGPTPDQLEALAREPTITKVFAGDYLDRGYDPVDPQEGYLSDFLFQKKAIAFGEKTS